MATAAKKVVIGMSSNPTKLSKEPTFAADTASADTASGDTASAETTATATGNKLHNTKNFVSDIINRFPKQKRDKVRRVLYGILPMIELQLDESRIIYSDGTIGSDLFSLLEYFLTNDKGRNKRHQHASTVGSTNTVGQLVTAPERPWDALKFYKEVLKLAGIRKTDLAISDDLTESKWKSIY